jgi:uncharacterized damage-inducible protein DinB
MTDLLADLYHYQSWADSQILAAVKQYPGAASDPEILKALHHIVGVQRFFLSQIRHTPFDIQHEMQVPSAFEELEKLFADTHAQIDAFTAEIPTLDFAVVLDRPPLDKMRPTIRTALVQVVLHSQHHRGQVASRLRALGAVPPTVDYILWVPIRGATK